MEILLNKRGEEKREEEERAREGKGETMNRWDMRYSIFKHSFKSRFFPSCKDFKTTYFFQKKIQINKRSTKEYLKK